MKTSQLLYQGESNTSAFMRAGSTVFDTVETLEHPRQVGLGNTDAGVADTELDAIGVPSQCDRDATLERELEGVRQEIQENLLPHLAIDMDRLWQRIALDDELKTSLFNRRSEHTGEVGRQPRQIRRLVVGVDAAGLNTREIQERVDETQESQGIAVGHLLSFPMHGRQWRPRICQAVFERADEQGQGRPQLVTDVAEERRLGPIERRQGFGTLSFLLVRARVGERRPQLVGDEIQERPVLIVERAPWIEPDDQSPSLGVGARRTNRQLLDQFPLRHR